MKERIPLRVDNNFVEAVGPDPVVPPAEPGPAAYTTNIDEVQQYPQLDVSDSPQDKPSFFSQGKEVSWMQEASDKIKDALKSAAGIDKDGTLNKKTLLALERGERNNISFGEAFENSEAWDEIEKSGAGVFYKGMENLKPEESEESDPKDNNIGQDVVKALQGGGIDVLHDLAAISDMVAPGSAKDALTDLMGSMAPVIDTFLPGEPVKEAHEDRIEDRMRLNGYIAEKFGDTAVAPAMMKYLEKYRATEGLNMLSQGEKDGNLRRWFTQSIRSNVRAAVPMIVGAPLGKFGAATASALWYGMSSFHRTMETATIYKKDGVRLSYDEAFALSAQVALSEGGWQGLESLAFMYIASKGGMAWANSGGFVKGIKKAFSPKNLFSKQGSVWKTLKTDVKEVYKMPGVKEWLKAYALKQIPSGTEVAQELTEGYLLKNKGLNPDFDPYAAAVEAIGVSSMSSLLWGAAGTTRGMVGSAMQYKQDIRTTRDKTRALVETGMVETPVIHKKSIEDDPKAQKWAEENLTFDENGEAKLESLDENVPDKIVHVMEVKLTPKAFEEKTAAEDADAILNETVKAEFPEGQPASETGELTNGKVPLADETTTSRINESDLNTSRPVDWVWQEGPDGSLKLSIGAKKALEGTSWEGAKTKKDIQKRIEQDTGMSFDEFSGIVLEESDRAFGDAHLAQKNGLYKWLTNAHQRELMPRTHRRIERERTINELAKRARKSRKRTIKEKLLGLDDRVINWLEAEPGTVEADVMWSNLTKEEQQFGKFAEVEFTKALAVGNRLGFLDEGISGYAPRFSRPFLEALGEDGPRKAFTEIWDRHKHQQERNDLSQNPEASMRVQLKNALPRTGDLRATKNLAASMEKYFDMLENKLALDAAMPKVIIAAKAMLPKNPTALELEAHEVTMGVINDWVKTHQGLRFEKMIKPGGKGDFMLDSVRGFTTFIDLAFSVPIGTAAHAGEGALNYQAMGASGIARATKRRHSKQGQKLLKNYPEFSGKGVWEQFTEASSTLGDKANLAMYGLFQNATHKANQQFLLGSITPTELKSGKISNERLAEMRLEMGKWRVVHGMGSTYGTTSEARVLGQYKKWAAPPMAQAAQQAQNMFDKITEGKEFDLNDWQAMSRAVEMGFVALMVGNAVSSDYEGIAGETIQKIKRELTSLYTSVDPDFWVDNNRTAIFFKNLSYSLLELNEVYENAPRKDDTDTNEIRKMLLKLTI